MLVGVRLFARIRSRLLPEPTRIPFLRIARPYGSESDFIDGDFAWVGRTTIILPHSPARPVGELVRFEFVLANGAPVLRGEGNVIAHHMPGGPRPPGLEVRFTRVDSKSKLIIDRVRERRAASMAGAPGGPTERPRAPATSAAAPEQRLALIVPSDTPSERSGVHFRASAARIAAPPNRDEILDRLRSRARELAASGRLAIKKA